ncbi:DUF2243 domain-containing protein [[Mycobacterium] burgundiense]|uniref:DUF2243 domain-containing protein n=1 Tax=[Mycobacterium] burgundiense TaxID=3064286 RepID=A0ABM9LT99_9MYCO|nr:DUF2243 domain-containing protein [Mycolicibacterium sp. MU0053]CAJ1504344.1 DUF2243 domain-containing protein [Mycolicibacterium sp. MU0053]
MAVSTHRDHPTAGKKPSIAPTLLLGLGLGGFIDGIVLHEILQWHHMVSHVADYPVDTLAGLEVNVLADGFFHVGTWLLVWAGTTLTIVAWRQGRIAPNWSFQSGLLLMGWGIFNLLEGLVDHHLLQIHHVRDDLGAPPVWDIGFLVFGALLVTVGWVFYRRGSRALDLQARPTRPFRG